MGIKVAIEGKEVPSLSQIKEFILWVDRNYSGIDGTLTIRHLDKNTAEFRMRSHHTLGERDKRIIRSKYNSVMAAFAQKEEDRGEKMLAYAINRIEIGCITEAIKTLADYQRMKMLQLAARKEKEQEQDF